MRLVAKVLLALILFCSPALASYETIAAKKRAPVPVPVCLTSDGFIKTTPPGYKFTRKLDGDVLKNFKANIAKSLTTAIPEDANTILLFENSPETTIFMVFRNDCLEGFGQVMTPHLAVLLEDNSI